MGFWIISGNKKITENKNVAHRVDKTSFWSNFCPLNVLNVYKVQKQPPEVFLKKGVLRNFAKFTGKHLCESAFFNKVAAACNVFLWILQNFSEHLFLQNTFGGCLLIISLFMTGICIPCHSCSINWICMLTDSSINWSDRSFFDFAWKDALDNNRNNEISE